MVQIASFAVVAAVLASQAAASTTCVPGQIYCGYSLIGTNSEVWIPRVRDALRDDRQPVDGTHESDSVFRCVGPTTLKFVDWCKKTPGNQILCQPANSGKCGPQGSKNDCCGPA